MWHMRMQRALQPYTRWGWVLDGCHLPCVPAALASHVLGLLRRFFMPLVELPVQPTYHTRASCHASIPRPALHTPSQACRHGHLAAARLLLRRGADAGLADARGDTPAHLAARHGHLELLAALLAAGEAMSGHRPTRQACAAHDQRMRPGF